jgi:hypothetical protein
MGQTIHKVSAALSCAPARSAQNRNLKFFSPFPAQKRGALPIGPHQRAARADKGRLGFSSRRFAVSQATGCPSQIVRNKANPLPGRRPRESAGSLKKE